jgi:hypothetical protein
MELSSKCSLELLLDEALACVGNEDNNEVKEGTVENVVDGTAVDCSVFLASVNSGVNNDIQIIKQKLSQKHTEFSNRELACIADNIESFSEEELHNIPHTYMPGTNRFLVNQTMEIMFVLKMVGKIHNINLKSLLPLFLKPYNKCFFPTLVKKKQCTQKRRHGCLTCSGHMLLENQTNIDEYIERLQGSEKKQKVDH